MSYKNELREAGLLKTPCVFSVRVVHGELCNLLKGGSCSCRPLLQVVKPAVEVTDAVGL
jgi:hypothetical protein